MALAAGGAAIAPAAGSAGPRARARPADGARRFVRPGEAAMTRAGPGSAAPHDASRHVGAAARLRAAAAKGSPP